ncbi:MAG: TolC family protein [Bryobacterales bacterium]|nr:TolC family protein [Bryobacterales bacterium]
MSSIRLYVGVAAAWFPALCWPQRTPAASSGELLVIAIQNNRELSAVRQRAEEARGLLKQAGVRPALTLEATGATGRPLGTPGEEQYGAGFSQTFETAGKRSRRIEVVEKQLALAEAEYDERVRQLRFEIRARYAELAGESERLGILDRLHAAYGQSLQLMTARVEQGDASALERDLLSVELNRTTAQRETAAGRLEAARADLARIAGLTDPQAVAAPRQAAVPQGPPDLVTLKESGLAKRPDLRAAGLLMEQGVAEIALAKAQSHADITLSAGYSRVYSSFDGQFGTAANGAITPLHDRDDILSAGVSVPLFGRKRNAGNIEAAVARSRGSQYRREFLERSIPLEIEGAWKRLNSARQAYQTLHDNVLRQAEKNLEVIRRAYELGQLRLLDVLNEQRRLLDTELAGVDAKLDVLRALAELERASGEELP